MTGYPEKITNEEQLEELLSRPCEKLTGMMRSLEGDIMFLGITGKIGPSLAMMAMRASREAGSERRIMGVSRHIDPVVQKRLDNAGIETVRGDLLDREFLSRLPLFRNVFFLAGMKFGSAGDLPLTWAINSYLPALVADHFRNSRIVAFSTGCVYPLIAPVSGGSAEHDMPVASGEYAQSCLGRERMFEYGSNKYGTKSVLIRLNYAVEMRYGVLVDIALKVKNKIPVDLSMGWFNVIWQGDMNRYVIQSLEHAQNPALILNITGPEILSVRETATRFGHLLGTEPVFLNSESDTALLSNSSRSYDLFGKPSVTADQLINWTAGWIRDEQKLLGKPTHFEVRDGKY